MTHSPTVVAIAAGLALAGGITRAVAAQATPDPAGPASAGSASNAGPAGGAGGAGSGSGAADSNAAPASADGSRAAPTPAPPPPDTGAAEPAGDTTGSAAAPAAGAQAETEVIEINDQAPAESASSVHLSTDDLAYRSRTQVSDILRQVPGLMVSQHAGGGKSDQYFIRGFDADHGTDIAIYADGIPVNMPSHGHGQGYADTHFLIPETISTVDVHKGPYAARFGDFYTAGAMELATLDKVDGPTLWIAGGVPLAGPRRGDQYNRRVVGMASPELRDTDTDRSLIAAQIADTDGPFERAQPFARATRWSSGRARSDGASSSSRPAGTPRPGMRRARSPSPPSRRA